MKIASHSRSLSVFILVAAGTVLPGCKSVDDRHADSIEASAATDGGYNSLNTALSASIARLQGLSSSPGSPATYLADIKSVETPLKNAADTLASARASLKSKTESQLASMQDEATKLQSADLAKDMAAKTAKLRGYFNDFDKAAAGIASDLDKGLLALNDVKIAVGANPTDAVVKITKGTLDNATDAFKSAQSKISGVRDTLGTLRDKQPRPVSR